MNISAILLAMVVVGGTGLLIAILLGIASEKFKVPVDEKEVAIRAELPGNNCGGCGYAGCDGLAKAIANGEAPVNGCPVGGAAAAEKISAIARSQGQNGLIAGRPSAQSLRILPESAQFPDARA